MYQNQITGDIETKPTYTLRLPKSNETFVSMYLRLLTAFKAEFYISTIEAMDILDDNREYLTNLIEIEGVIHTGWITKLIAQRY
jgi:hypothetical protein